ncbi:hypothetical protein V6N12_050098 [Hibiscus sabdariffa]|uniref:Uncharacterized protein n=1 Tax=Hibiscus sabdariffa TaxID=183260 RepID=A0ABR2GCK3_9ROSI
MSVASLGSHSAGEQDRVLSPCWSENQLWGLNRSGKDRAESASAITGVEWSTSDRGGVRSAGVVLYAIMGARSRECVAVEQAPEFTVARDSPLGYILVCDGAKEKVSGLMLGSVRKVKSVNLLVEALGSLAQWCVVAAARSRTGRGRPTKGISLVEAGGDVVNASLTDSDIQIRQ